MLEGVSRLLMLVAAIGGFTVAYFVQSGAFSQMDLFFSFLGIGALVTVLIWIPIKYVLKGFAKKPGNPG